MTQLALNSKERVVIEELVRQAENVRQLRRAQALLWLSEGDTVPEVAQRLRVSRATLYNWIGRWMRRTDREIMARLTDAARSGRPRTARGLIEPLIDTVIDQDPRHFGYRSTVWTAPLLQQHLHTTHGIEVSVPSVRLALARLGIRWKRPRQVLARRSATWRQAKGGSNAA